MKSCITCGMPFTGAHAQDIAFETTEGPVCVHDSENGQLKSAAVIFEGGVQFFRQAVTNGERELALRLTRRNMKSLPYWQNHPFPALEGDEATDAEFAEAMAKL